MEQVIQKYREISIEVAPCLARGRVNGRENILVAGCIRAASSIAEALLVAGEEVRGRIAYGRNSGAMPSDPEGKFAREDRARHVHDSRSTSSARWTARKGRSAFPL
jgi:hypothetical protein